MKKAFFLLTVFMLSITLVACNQTATPVNNNGKSKGESSLTLEEVFNQSLKAAEEITSFSMAMNLDQEISFQDNTETLQSIIDMDMTTEPLAFYQKMTMEIEGLSDKFETESYFSKDGMYFFDPEQNTWMKFPTEMSEQILQISGKQSNPLDEMKKLEKFIDDFTFEQDDNNYILKLNASGDKFEQLIKETIQDTLPNEFKDTLEAFDEMKIENVYYEYVIDKKTFLPIETKVKMDMEITVEGENYTLKQNVHGKYKDYNKVKEIVIPKEIIDQAVEIQM